MKVEVGSLRQGLETLARLSPDFFLRLAASVEQPPEASGLAAPPFAPPGPGPYFVGIDLARGPDRTVGPEAAD